MTCNMVLIHLEYYFIFKIVCHSKNSASSALTYTSLNRFFESALSYKACPMYMQENPCMDTIGMCKDAFYIQHSMSHYN